MYGCPRWCKRFLNGLGVIGCRHVSGLSLQRLIQPRVGDRVAGFMSRPHERGELAYAGRTHRVSGTTAEDILALEKWLRDGSQSVVHNVPRNPDERSVAPKQRVTG